MRLIVADTARQTHEDAHDVAFKTSELTPSPELKSLFREVTTAPKAVAIHESEEMFPVSYHERIAWNPQK